MAVYPDQSVKGGDAKLTAPPKRRGLLYAAAGAGLLLLGLGIGLAIGLPLAFKNKNSSKGEAVQLSAGGDGSVNQIKGTTRTFYLAADPIDWDYVPSRKNLCTNQAFTDESALYVSKGIGTKYKKAVYRQYKDESFKVG